jgi:deoxyribonuclease-4
MGVRGVVVHVGKHCKSDLNDSLKRMKNKIIEIIECATPECPLLLETPAGQGTEVLTDMIEFLDFVWEIRNDQRVVEKNKSECFSVCIDTCHVFATGVIPSLYLKTALQTPKYNNFLKLIHFNDSKGACGSCVDRHAILGEGVIGIEELHECAQLGVSFEIPMVFE